MAIMGTLKGHKDQITCLKTSVEDPTLLLSGSRDKTVAVWTLDQDTEQNVTGKVKKRLVGHHHIVQDLDLSSDGQYALSASWDKSIRLWHLESGRTTKKFLDKGHSKDVLSVVFSADNRQIVS